MADSNSVTLSVDFDYRKPLSKLQKDLRSVERDISFNPKLNARNFSQPLGQISRNLDEFTGSLDAANKRVLAFGASAAVIGGTIKAFSELAKATIQVEKAFSEINSVFGLSSTQLDQFSKDLFKISRDTAQSFDVAAKAALEFSRQGLGVEETGKRVAAALTLSRQSGLDGAKSVDALTAALNGFQRENLSAIQVVNKLIAVDTKFAVSSADLAEALSRVGNTAQDAGVNLNELIGLVTAAQQITARGGTVIGNAFKTIFTRVTDSGTIDQLEELGIVVKDVQGALLPVNQILKNISTSFDGLSESQKNSVAQLTAGTFQINQLKAILSDLGRSYSIAEQATLAASNATDQATKRNELLNKSLASLLQNTKTTFTEIGSLLGKATFTNPLKTLLGDINEGSITEYLNNIVTKKSGLSLGETVGKGVLEGIGNILTGPGLAIALGLISKVAGRTLREVAGGAGEIVGNNNTKEREQKTIAGINNLLAQATQQEQQRFKVASSVEEKERIILGLLEQQNAVRAAQNSSNNAVARSLITKTPNQARSLRVNAAGGLLPIGAERKAINQGVGGARSNAKPVVIPNFAFGKGKYGTVVANTDEYLVPNFANGGSAIFNREMVGKFGMPKGAQKINAAGGFIPSFNTDFENYLGSSSKEHLELFKVLQKKDPKLAQYIIENGDRASTEAITSMTGIKKGIQITPPDLGTSTYFDLQKTPEDLRGKLSEVFGRYKAKSPLAGGYIPSFATLKTENDSYVNYGQDDFAETFSGKRGGLKIKYLESKKKGDAFKLFQSLLSKSKENNQPIISEELLPRPLRSIGPDFQKLSNFEKLTKVFPQIRYRDVGNAKTQGVMEGVQSDALNGRFYDLNNLKEKINKIDRNKFLNDLGTISFRRLETSSLASGYIPNFANPLQDALKREKEAGIPANQIYVDTDKRLKSQQNPMGLMVANRRDEPRNGAQGVNRVLKQGGDPRKSGMANGFIPNFATPEDFFVTGKDNLQGPKGFVDRKKLALINNAIELYAAALKENSAILKKEAVNAIKNAGLKDKSEEKVLLSLEQYANAKKQEAADARKAIVEQNRAAKKLEAEQLKAIKQATLDQVKADKAAKTTIPGQLSPAQQASIKNAPIFANNSAPSTSGPFQPNQTPNLAAKLSREADEAIKNFAAASKKLNSNPLFSSARVQGQIDSRSGITAFEKQQGNLRRTSDLSSFTDKLRSGDALSKPDNQSLQRILRIKGKEEASSALGSGASNKAIEAFADRFIKNANTQLGDAFKNATKFKTEADVFSKVEKKLTGYRNIFSSIDKEIDGYIKNGTLSADSGRKLKESSAQIKERRTARLQSAGLAASFVLPFAAGFVPQRQGGSEGAALRGGVAGALQGAGTGAALGSFFGPLGTAIGAGAGAIGGGIIGALQKSTKSLEEFAQVVADVNSKNQSQVDAIQQYIQIQQQLNEAIDRGDSPAKRQNIQNRQAGVLSRIQDPEARKSLLNSGGNIEKQFEALSRVADKAGRSSQGLGVAESLVGASKGGFQGKDIKSAVDSLVSATNTSEKNLADAFNKFKATFKNDPVSSYKDLAQAFGQSQEIIDDTVKEIKKNPNELRFIFQQYVETLDRFNEEAKISTKDANRRQVQANFGRALRQGGQEISAGTELESQNRASKNRIISSNQLAAINSRGLPQLEAGRAEGQANLSNAIRELGDQMEIGVSRQRSSIATALGQTDTADGINESNRATLAEFIGRDSLKPEDFKNFADTFKTSNETIYNTLISSYNELVSIRNNGENSVNEIKESNKRLEILNKAEERNRLLSGGQFNAGNTDALFQSRLAGRTRNSGRGGKATQFNAINDQVSLLDGLGFSETGNTRSLRESSRRQSVNTTASDLLSQITGGSVGTSSEEINKEIDKFLKSIDTASLTFQELVDKDTVERIQRGLKSLDFTPEEQQKQLLNAGSSGTGTADAVSTGKLSFGEGSLITGLQALGTNLKSPLDSINSNLGAGGPIAKLLEQIKDNRELQKEFGKEDKLTTELSNIDTKITELRGQIKEGRTNSVSFGNINDQIRSEITKADTVRNEARKKVRGPLFSEERSQTSLPLELAQGRVDALVEIENFLKKQEILGKSPVEALDAAKLDESLRNSAKVSAQEIGKILEQAVNKASDANRVVGRGSTTKLESDLFDNQQRKKEVEGQINSLEFKKLSETVEAFSGKMKGIFDAHVDFFKKGTEKTSTGNGTTTQNSPVAKSNSSTTGNTDSLSTEEISKLIKKAELEGKITNKLAEQKLITNQLASVNKELTDSADLSLKKRIALTNELLALELDLAREQGDGLKSLSLGFKQHFVTLKQQMNDLSDVGASVAQSLEGNLGNAFGDFVTGAKTGKDAFRSFAIGILNDAARAFASKAVQQLLGAALGSYGGFKGGDSTVKRAKGGEIPSFANGGGVPALVMGGEYYFNAEQTRSIGKGFLGQLNQGAAAPYASGGLIKGGSGIKDDIPAQLDAGGYVIKKSSVNKYGSNYLDSLGNGSVQRKFWGGALIGAVSGAAIGYATAPKKDRKKAALYGAIGGGIAGGLAQNQSQSGNAFKTGGDKSGFFSFSRTPMASTGTAFDGSNANFQTQSAPKLTFESTKAGNLSDYYGGVGVGGTRVGAAPAVSRGSSLQSSLTNAGVAGALGIGAALLNKSGSPDVEDDSLKAYREEEERYNANLARLRSGQGSAFLSSETGYINGVGQGNSARRFAKGGLIKGGSGVKDDLMTKLQSGGFVMKKSAVNRVGKGYLDKLAGGGQPSVNINRYAEGGEVEGSMPETANVNINGMDGNKKAGGNNNAPQVYIKIDINNNGETSSSSESSNKSGEDNAFGEDFAKRLEKQIRTTVKDELIQQSRVGGLDNKIKRTRQ